jgi:hypothetical protein
MGNANPTGASRNRKLTQTQADTNVANLETVSIGETLFRVRAKLRAGNSLCPFPDDKKGRTELIGTPLEEITL